MGGAEGGDGAGPNEAELMNMFKGLLGDLPQPGQASQGGAAGPGVPGKSGKSQQEAAYIDCNKGYVDLKKFYRPG